MENDFGVDGEFNMNELISELLQGRDAVNRLQMCLNNAPLLSSSSSQDWSCEVLANKVMSSFENALCMLNHAGRNESSDSDREVRDANSGRRRKAAVWTDQVQVSPGEGLEEAHEDGYNWRKYGQKRILGAQFPKGYYRCSHLYSQGCLAKKEIQKSDEDPTVFNVRYRGSHTCNNPSPPLPSPPPTLDNQEPSKLQIQQEDNFLNSPRNLKIKTDNIEASGHGHDENPFPSSPSYDFASSSGGIKVGEIHCSFPQPPTVVVGNSFVSPAATSGSSCFTMSPTTTTTTTPHVENLGGGGSQFVPTTTTSDLEMIMEIPTATSGTNSPVVSMGFPFDTTMAFDFNFTFEF